MKKLAAIILIALLIIPTAYAIEWKDMTDEEIIAEINKAKAELLIRGLIGVDGNITVVDESGITIVITSLSLDTSYWAYNPALFIDYIIVNESDDDHDCYIDNLAINGWEVDTVGYCSAAAGHKAKGTIKVDAKSADIAVFDDIEALEISFIYEDKNGYKHTPPVTVYFN